MSTSHYFSSFYYDTTQTTQRAAVVVVVFIEMFHFIYFWQSVTLYESLVGSCIAVVIRAGFWGTVIQGKVL